MLRFKWVQVGVVGRWDRSRRCLRPSSWWTPSGISPASSVVHVPRPRPRYPYPLCESVDDDP
ncbi:hypothetical protein AG1IA_01726 [Rhizoctonia solani AG-1 IA]|uniref:Uncharacterized protein n=1 Tax=Thanatephorus cucumeris (strain AG1-IA) TaxID=983506 RepID=L8X576_THACA|nr:hypothetical protein AG1IA_01726 [Rhizoctonia solani AG-1 IA]